MVVDGQKSASTDLQNNEIAIYNSTKKVILENSKIKNNGAGTSASQEVRQKYSTIYVNNAELDFGAGIDISANVNPIRLSKAILSMSNYDFRIHGSSVTGISAEEDIIIEGNTGDYVIGVENDNESNIYFKQGQIVDNVGLLSYNRRGNNYTGASVVGNMTYDGLFGYILNTTNTADMKQTNVYFGGNIQIQGNKRAGSGTTGMDDTNANMPIEIVPEGQSYSDPTYRHFNSLITKVADGDFTDSEKMKLKDGVEDTRLGRNAKITFSAINSVGHDIEESSLPEGVPTGYRASQIVLFKMQGDDSDYISFSNNYIQGYDSGTGGAVPATLFTLDTYKTYIYDLNDGSTNKLYDFRVIYFNATSDTSRVFAQDDAELIQFTFDMIYPTSEDEATDGVWVEQLSPQRVQKGSTAMRPIRDYSLADDTSAIIYTQGAVGDAKYRLIDVAGNLNPQSAGDGDPTKRFAPWDWGTIVTTGGGGNWNPKLFAIYANVKHMHKTCGTSNDDPCDHLNPTGSHKEYGGNLFAAQGDDITKTCIDVHDPRQLLYMANHPEYMYVLSKDIHIPAEIEGVKTADVLNNPDRPIKGATICLNGYKIIVDDDVDFLSLCGDCYIVDCQSDHTADGYGTIQYQNTTGTNGSLFNFTEHYETTESSRTKNTLNINGTNLNNARTENDKLTFTNIAANNNNQSFVEGLIDTDEVRLFNVEFSDNNVTAPILKTVGTVALDEVNVKNNTFNSANRSIVELHEAYLDDATNVAGSTISIRGCSFDDNTISSNNSSVVHIEANKTNSSVNFELSQINTDRKNSVSNNTISNRAAIHIGNNNESNAVLSIDYTKFDKNFVPFNTTADKIYGAGLYLQNVWTNEGSKISNSDFTNNGIDAVSDPDSTGSYTNAYHLMNSINMYGAGLCAINDKTSDVDNTTKVISLNEVTFDNNVAKNGGGIYLENFINTNIDGTTTRFRGNAAKDGAALYIDYTNKEVLNRGSITLDTITIENNGAIYTPERTHNTYIPIANVTDAMKTGSVVYFAAQGKSNGTSGEYINLSINNPNVKHNFATDGIFKLGNSTYENDINFTGDEIADIVNNGIYEGSTTTLYYGGPIISYANELNDEYKPGVNIEAETTITTKIEKNFVGQRKAIETGTLGGANQYAHAYLTYTRRVRIRDNFAQSGTTYTEANVRMRPNFKLNITDEFDSEHSYVFFNTDYHGDEEMQLTTWSGNVNFNNNPMIEHYYDDVLCPLDGVTGLPVTVTRAADDSTVIYKGNADVTTALGTSTDYTMAFIGDKKFANPIIAAYQISDLSSTTPPASQIGLWAQRGATIEIDQYEQTADTVYNGFKKYAIADMSAAGFTVVGTPQKYIGKTSTGEYRTWGFINNTDAFTVNTYKVSDEEKVEHLDYIWYTSDNNHTSDVSAHGSFNSGNEWIAAYSENFLHATYQDGSKSQDRNMPGVSNVDIKLVTDIHLTEAITNKVGTNICLGSSALFAPENDNLLRLQSETTDYANTNGAKSVAFLQCDTSNNFIGIHGYNSSNSRETTAGVTNKPLFNLRGLNSLAPSEEATLYLEGVRIGWFNYGGDTDGAIISASYSNVYIRESGTGDTARKTRIIGNATNGSSFDFNSHTPIYLTDTNVSLRNFVVSDIGTESANAALGENGFLYMNGSDNYQDVATNIIYSRNKFTEDLLNVNVERIHFDSAKAFFNFEDVMGNTNGVVNVNYNVANDIHNYREKAKGAYMYVSIPNANALVERTINICSTGTNRTDASGKITKLTTNGYGPFIYVEDFNGPLYNSYFNINISSIESRYVLGIEECEAKYDGGCIYFNTKGTNNARLNLKLSDVSMNKNKAGHDGGAIYINQESWNAEYPTKNKLYVSLPYNIVDDDMITRYTENEASNNGGAFYVTDTILNIDEPERNDARYVYFNNNEAGNQGGFLWQKRSISEFYAAYINVYGNKSLNDGAAIYVDGGDIPLGGESRSIEQMHDSITFGIGGRTGYSDGSSRIEVIKGNVSTNNKGLITIGTYSDMYIDGALYAWDGDSHTSHTNGTEVMYIKGEGMDNETLTNLGVERKVSEHFVPNTNDPAGATALNGTYVIASVERMDKLFISGWDRSVYPNMSYAIKPSANYYHGDTTKEMSVYSSGENANANVHIGYVDAKIQFITYLKNDPTKIKKLGVGAAAASIYEEPSSIGSTKQLTVDLDGLRDNAIALSGYSASDFLGFLAYVSDSSGANKRFDLFEIDDYVYTELEETYIIAMWKTDDSATINGILNGYNTNSFNKDAESNGYSGVGDFDLTEIINNYTYAVVDCYEQLYFNQEHIGYKLNKNIYDGWTKTTGGDNTNGFTVEAYGSVATAISGNEEVIYLNGKKIYKQKDTALYNNESGSLVMFDNGTVESGITIDTTKDHSVITHDMIKANKVQIIGKLPSGDAKTTVGISKLEFAKGANLINMDIADNHGELYLLGTYISETKNATIKAPAYTYTRNARFDKNNISDNDALIVLNNSQKVDMIQRVSDATTYYGGFIKNAAKSIIKIDGTYTIEADDLEPVFGFDNILWMSNVSYTDSTRKTAIINATQSNSTQEQIISISNSKIINNNINTTDSIGNNYFGSIINSYGHRIALTNTQIDSNIVNDNIIEQHKGSNIAKLQHRIRYTKITNNEVVYARTNTSKSEGKGFVIYQDYVDTDGTRSANLIEGVTITNSPVNGAIYNSAGPTYYVLGGENIIKDNKNKDGVQNNFVLNNAVNSDQTVSFLNSEMDLWDDETSNMLSTKSYISITMADMTDADEYKIFANNTWTSDYKVEGAIHNKIFYSDNENYLVAKQINNLIIIKKTSTKLVKTGFEPYDDAAVGDFAAQYLYIDDMNATLADEPIVPTSTNGAFIRWNLDEYLSSEYSFDETSGEALEGEGTPRIATIYGLWRKDITVTVVTNNGGTGRDGTPLPNVLYNGTTVENIKLTVPMGSQLFNATKLTYGSTEVTTGLDVKPEFTREGMTNGIYWKTKNGFNGGLNDGDWGEDFLYNGNGDSEYNVVKDMELYVVWQGEPFNMYYEYYDTLATVSTMTANTYIDPETGNSYAVQHYNSPMVSGTMQAPVRHGYNFINWHSSPSESFSDSNIINQSTIYLWNYDITAYAEWKPKDYPIVYVAKPGEVDDGHGNPSLATRVNATKSFDIGLRNPSYKFDDIPFERNGYTLVSWDYSMDDTDPVDADTIAVGSTLGSRNLYNARVQEESGRYVEYEGPATELKANWEPNNYRLI